MNLPPPPPDGPESSALEPRLRKFDLACRLGERPRIEDFLPDSPPRLPALVELVHIELEYRLRAGENASLGEYLHRFPELAEAESALGGLRDAYAQWSAQPPDLPPRPHLDRYRLFEVLGTGGCATVYRGHDTRLGRAVAVKVPRQGQLATPEEVERFLREAQSAAGLHHPGIVPVHDAGQSDGVCFLVSEYIPGTTLAQRLRSHPLPPPREAAILAALLADALQHAHDRGVVHRDVKPSNILLDADGRPHLGDFGLALRDAGDATLTAEGDVLGTPAYMAPEQARGEAHRVDGRTDVYSLGVVLYELLTGQRPFQGTARMVLRQVQEEEPRPPRRLNDQLPRDLETVCLKAMAKARGDRYASASEFAADLRSYLAGEPVHARPVGPVGRGWRWARRRPAVTALAVSLLLSLQGGLAGVFWQWRRAEANYQQARRTLREARLAIIGFHRPIAAARREGLAGSALLVELRKRTIRHLEQFRGELDDPAVQLALANCYLGLAYETRDAGQKRDSLDAARKAWALLQVMSPGRVDPFLRRRYLATSHRMIAAGLEHEGDVAGAIESTEQECAVLSELADDQPEQLEWLDRLASNRRNLVALCRRAGDPAGAGKAERSARGYEARWLSKQGETAMPATYRPGYLRHMGKDYEETGRPAEARRSYEEAVALYREMLRGQRATLLGRKGLAASLHVLGRMSAEEGDPEGSLARLTEARDLREQIVRDQPSSAMDKSDLTGTLWRLGLAQSALGLAAEAVASWRRAEGLLEALLREHPGRADDRARLTEVRRAIDQERGGAGQPR